MVGNGWNVTAVDADKLAKNYLLAKISFEKTNQVKFIVSSYENYDFNEKVCLINASFALPFCSPQNLQRVMERITHVIFTGGRFSGHFFGPNDSWAKEQTMSFTTKADVQGFLAKALS